MTRHPRRPPATHRSRPPLRTGWREADPPDPDAVAKLLAAGGWRSDAGVTYDGPWQVRWRAPLLAKRNVGDYRTCLVVGTSFAPEARGPLPHEDEALTHLEAALREALEPDGTGILLAVSTGLGERVFVFHVRDPVLATSRLGALAQARTGVLEVESFDDPALAYLRDEVLDGLIENG